ncbi:hypothetical protein, partial [Pseudomonas syringae]|uniref:hypothetical protein n=1 Tax=Pseudomonas syringae TaxID=317 RepID=UPI001F2D3E00
CNPYHSNVTAIASDLYSWRRIFVSIHFAVDGTGTSDTEGAFADTQANGYGVRWTMTRTTGAGIS